VNFVDIYQRTGLYPLPLPFTEGLEGAGIVSALGPGVDGPSVGDRVAFASVQGAYAEAIAVPADLLVPVPPAIGLDVAAASLLQGMTAHFLLHSIHTFEPNDWCLVQAAAGGLGLLLTQMAKRLGLRVIGTTSSSEKAERARAAGADRVVLYTREDVVDAVADATNGQGVSAVFDSVGRTTFDASLRCLRPRGSMILCGQSSGTVDPVDPARLQYGGSLVLTRPRIADFIATREELLWRSSEVFSMVEAGEIDVHIHARSPLDRAADAHRALESRVTSGKLLLSIGE
jgi:NADPH2:quinone reductase